MLHVDRYANCALTGFEGGQHGIARRMFQKLNKPWLTQYLRHFVMRKVNKVCLTHAESPLSNGSNSYDFFTFNSFLTTNQKTAADKLSEVNNKSIQHITSKSHRENVFTTLRLCVRHTSAVIFSSTIFFSSRELCAHLYVTHESVGPVRIDNDAAATHRTAEQSFFI